MKIMLIAFVMIVALGVLFAFARYKSISKTSVTATDIPAIFEKLRAVGKDGSFAVFIFLPGGSSSSNDAINVQFSIEGGRIGFDWVLLGPANIRDKEKFVRLAQELGYKVIDRGMNQVKYLRVEEGGNLPGLCEATLRDIYAVPSDAKLGLVSTGFTWP